MDSIDVICKTDIEDLHIGPKRICLLYLCLIYPEYTYRCDFLVNPRTGDLRTGKEICEVLDKTFRDDLPHLNLNKTKALSSILKQQQEAIISIEKLQKRSNERRQLLAKYNKGMSLPHFRMEIMRNYKNIPLFAFADYGGKGLDASDIVDIVICTSDLKPGWWQSYGKRLLSLGIKAGAWVLLGGVAAAALGPRKRTSTGSAKNGIINIAISIFEKCGVRLDATQVKDKSYINAKYREASKLVHPDKGAKDAKLFRALVISKAVLQNSNVPQSDIRELISIHKEV